MPNKKKKNFSRGDYSKARIKEVDKLLKIVSKLRSQGVTHTIRKMRG